MKRSKKILILSVIFILVIVAYMGTVKLTSQDGKDIKNASITVKEIDPSSISQISWERDSKSITLINTNGTWTFTGDETFPLDQSYPSSMVSAIANLKASRVMDETEELKEYGLDSPYCKITILLKDGTQTTYSIGDMNEVTSEYYLMINEEKAVYMIDKTLKSAFDYSLDDMKVKE